MEVEGVLIAQAVQKLRDYYGFWMDESGQHEDKQLLDLIVKLNKLLDEDK